MAITKRLSRRILKGAMVLALGTAAMTSVGVSAAHAARDNHGCPSGYVCVYPGAGWGSNTPSLKFYTYGVHKISNQYGMHRVFNNQTDRAWAKLCRGSDGTGCDDFWFAGIYGDANLTPINSILLHE